MIRPYLDDELCNALFPGQNVPEALKRLRAWIESPQYLEFAHSMNLPPTDWLTLFKLAVSVRPQMVTAPPPTPQAQPIRPDTSFEIDISL